MIRKLLCMMALTSTGLAVAQEGTTSPYSYYGIGEQRFRSTNEIKDMANMAVFTDSLHMNTLNPASYGQLQRATLSIGASYKHSSLKSNQHQNKTVSGSIDYLTFSVPVKKIGLAVGIMPHTFSGYKVANNTNSGDMTLKNTYSGEGGINRAFFGIGYKINNSLSLGVDAAYLFGENKQTTIKFVTNTGENFALDRGIRAIYSNRYKGIDFNIAANYKQKISNKNFLHFNGTFSPETKLSNNYSTTIDVVKANVDDYIAVETEQIINAKKEIVNPMRYSLGVGIGNPFKWFIGTEYSFSNTQAYNNTFIYDIARYENSQRFALGGFYSPKYNSFTSVFERATYRAGIRYENTGLVINNQKINDMAIHAGIGIPVGMYTSNLNIGLEYGKKGTKNNNLIQENYFSVSIGLSLNDRWFEKRRFN